MKKILFLGLLFIFSAGLFFTACADLDRDNILDPKNASSKRDGRVVAELFTTTGPDVPAVYNQYNAYALNAIDSLQKDYGPRFITLVYHRNSSRYKDAQAVPLVEPYYEEYTIHYDSGSPGRFKGVPDLFINGPALRVQGASSVHSVIVRAQALINKVLPQSGLFTIESDIEKNGDNITGTLRIAPLGNKESPDLRVRVLLTRDDGLFQRVLVLGNPVDIGIIKKGAFKEQKIMLDTRGLAVQNIYFLMRDAQTRAVLYARGEPL